MPRFTPTSRGKGLLCCGVALIIYGWAGGIRDAARIGAVLVLLPVVANIVISRKRFQLAVQRQIKPRCVSAGVPAQATVRITNLNQQETFTVFGEDVLPPVLGRGPRFTIPRLEQLEQRSATYTLRSMSRGRYGIGPIRLKVRDPFGLAEQTHVIGEVTSFVVTPQVNALPPISLGGILTSGEHSGLRALTFHGDDDVGTRPWRDGDDLRRIHWRTTARTGELAVRREEQPLSASATILLDTRAAAHSGSGRTSSFEWAVSAAASIAAHLGTRGLPCRLLSASGQLVDPGQGGTPRASAIVDALAVVEPERLDVLPTYRNSASTGVLFVILGALSTSDLAVVQANRGSGQGVAILLDTERWTSSAGSAPSLQRAAEALRTAGWQVLIAGPDDRLDQLWATLGASLRGTA